MTRVSEKRPRLRLDPKSYRELCQQVLQRDGWRCQTCGSSTDLQVHHVNLRSRLGDDAEENLVTLCAKCHNEVHQKSVTVK
jgi:5-methylcytosine-specific restriction endonuclease McrA